MSKPHTVTPSQPWVLPPLAIVCPECGCHLGQCWFPATARQAIGTHVLTECPGPAPQ